MATLPSVPAETVLVERILAQIDREALAADCLAYVSVPSETGQETAGAHFLADLIRCRG